MIKVDVSGYGENRLPRWINKSALIQIFGDVEEAQTGVDDEVAITPFHHPNVGAISRHVISDAKKS